MTAGGKQYTTRLATLDEIKVNAAVKNLVDQSRESRWLALRADEAFPADTTVVVNIGPGTPSAEGPGIPKDFEGVVRDSVPLSPDEIRANADANRLAEDRRNGEVQRKKAQSLSKKGSGQ